MSELKCVTTSSFRRAIIHVDMDAFFATCEQQRDPKLKNMPLVVGLERGIATSMSYEAKALGVTRGMKVADIRALIPNVVIVPSDYETYGLYSLRLFDIVRRYASELEEYSIDECFADVTGMRRPLNMTYPQIVAAIKHDIDTELGTSASVGLAPTKTLAKIASKWKKPSGTQIISGLKAQYYLQHVPVEKVWGIGDKTASFLRRWHVKTSLDFAYKRKEWVYEKLTKPHQQTWHELRGEACIPFQTEPVNEYRHISKRKTFTPASSDYVEVYGRLCKNVENACIKARRYGLRAARAHFSIKSQNFIHYGAELELAQATNAPTFFIEAIEPLFKRLFRGDVRYRTTSFVLLDLTPEPMQYDLFSQHNKIEKVEHLYAALDTINHRFGKHTVRLGASHLALKNGDHAGERGELAWRKRPENWLPGETERRRVNLPFRGYVK